uniref:Uncharacterized protein n=1 Tax=Euplotes crassus TaxID=5936 RepID=A0A7S3KCR8_EUPCR|mmetsp:Transcript_17977/g.17705  ORF Transcript_17977/g.17705 Transcript_17977/m.17705 type:complete len:256 (+) Transcript_17977:409-1176(+)
MITKRQIEAAPSEERIDKKKYFKYKKEIASSDSSGYFNREDSSNMKKRELKELMKNMQDSNSSNMSKEKRLQRESNSDSSVKLFKIEKVSKSRTESLSNSNSDLKKMCQEKSAKASKSKDKRSNKDARMNIKKGCCILLLNKGKIIIQGNRIESSIPVELQKYDGDINTVIPDYPCQILIEPLTTSRSLSRSQKNIKGTSQSMKGENVKPLLTTGSYSTNATSRRTYQQTPMHQDNELIKGMEILQNIFCCCVKR